jgi:hypothetical protein
MAAIFLAQVGLTVERRSIGTSVIQRIAIEISTQTGRSLSILSRQTNREVHPTSSVADLNFSSIQKVHLEQLEARRRGSHDNKI